MNGIIIFDYCVFFFFYFVLSHQPSYIKTYFMQGLLIAFNITHLIKKYAEYSDCAVSLYVGCCSGVRCDTLKV